MSAKFLGFSTKDAAAIGVGMAPRGEVAMIVALLGLSDGIIQQDMYLSLMMMSLATTMIVPPILRRMLTQPTTTQPLKNNVPFFPRKRGVGGNDMTAIKTAFCVVAALFVLMAAALAGVNYVTVDTISTTEHKAETQNVGALVTAVPMTTTIVSDASTSEAVEVKTTDFDPSLEMQYIYMQSENIDGSYAELNEIQERMYDVAEDYNEVEYDMLQEKIDNARTVVKEERDREDPERRDSGDGEAEDERDSD